MAYGFNTGIVIKVMLKKIFRFAVLLILRINLKSFYNCLARLGNIQEKQLIVDVMNLCQSYKKQKMIEVK